MPYKSKVELRRYQAAYRVARSTSAKRKYSKAWYAANRERQIAAANKWRRLNPLKANRAARKYYQRNRKVLLEKANRKSLAIRKASGRILNSKCFVCKRSITPTARPNPTCSPSCRRKKARAISLAFYYNVFRPNKPPRVVCCVVCSLKFTTRKRGSGKTCSPKCSNLNTAKLNREYKKRNAVKERNRKRIYKEMNLTKVRQQDRASNARRYAKQQAALEFVEERLGLKKEPCECEKCTKSRAASKRYRERHPEKEKARSRAKYLRRKPMALAKTVERSRKRIAAYELVSELKENVACL